MNRRDFIQKTALLSAGACAIPAISFAQNSPFSLLRNDVGFFSMRGGTIGWLANNDGIIAIDSQYVEPATQFIAGITNFGNGPEKMLFNTHHHGDHTSGNSVFAENRYHIIAHKNVPELQLAGAQDGQEPTVATQTFDESVRVTMGNETARATYYGRGHTRGDSVIWFQNANIAHMGDLMFNRAYPFIDIDGGASVKNWITLLETASKKADSDTIFIFGHANPEFGVTGDRSDLLYMRDFLSHLYQYTQQGIDEGKSVDELAEIDQFEEFPTHIAPSDFLSLSRNIQAVYREITES